MYNRNRLTKRFPEIVVVCCLVSYISITHIVKTYFALLAKEELLVDVTSCYVMCALYHTTRRVTNISLVKHA
jgi:hypothetical protein